MTTGGIKVHRAVVSCHIYALKGELCDDPKSSYAENKACKSDYYWISNVH